MSATFKLHLGDCIATMRGMSEASVDAIVTDPPYELGFMGKGWDATGIANSVEMWGEALRVLKPGGHLLAFSGSRTYHRMVCAIEDAGFEIRDQIMWIYGSGFPKSLDVSKAIDKAQRRGYVLAAVSLGLQIPGNNLHDWTKAEHAPGDKWWGEFKAVLSAEQWGAIEREVTRAASAEHHAGAVIGWDQRSSAERERRDVAATDAARQWQGWGTALKPAHEPIVVARKPLIGTVAANVLAHGTGALNIDGCRVGDEVTRTVGSAKLGTKAFGDYAGMEPRDNPPGRWPANLIHDGSAEVLAAFPQAPGQQGDLQQQKHAVPAGNAFGQYGPKLAHTARKDAGSAARFFYAAKASKADRGAENVHPTVKPTDLMAYLVRLVTPPGGTVLDPFTGSGSTGKACMREGFNFVGCELSPEYLAIAQARIEYEQLQAAHRAYLDILKAA